MDVVSLCALRAFGFEWQPRAGTHVLTIVCKATFMLRPDVCALAPDQEEPSNVDLHWNDDPGRSVVVPSDRAPYKLRADVVLVGRAHAPKQQPVRAIVTRLVVGEIDKSIEVWCSRSIKKYGDQVVEGQRMTQMPLTWERAAGGPETNNPAGSRLDAAPDRDGMVALPNLQPPGVYVGQWGDTFAPIGYGPIAPKWPSRVQRLHRHISSFDIQGWENQPLPADFDYGYFNVAPLDQQIAELRPDERILLENMHADHERLVTKLPGIRPRAIADRATGEREELPLVADTLWIDTDRKICTVVWRGQLGLRHSQEKGRVAFWIDGHPMEESVSAASKDSPVSSRAARKYEDRPVSKTLTLIPGDDAEKGPILPFLAGAPAPPPLVGMTPQAPPAWLGARASMKISEGMSTLVGATAEKGKDPLPFVRAAGASPGSMSDAVARPAPPPVDSERLLARAETDDGTGTAVEPMSWRGKDALPFVRAPSPALPVQPPPVSEPMPAFAPLVQSALVPDVAAPRMESSAKKAAPGVKKPIDKATIERHAEVKAELWTKGDPRAAVEDVLRELGIDEDEYREGEVVLRDALAEEAKIGGSTLSRAVRVAVKRAQIVATTAGAKGVGERASSGI